MEKRRRRKLDENIFSLNKMFSQEKRTQIERKMLKRIWGGLFLCKKKRKKKFFTH
jgi:hypothetical protein